MPNKIKKCTRKKKKIPSSNSFPKKKSNLHYNKKIFEPCVSTYLNKTGFARKKHLCDNGGVKRILTPFNFSNTKQKSISPLNKHKTMPLKSTYWPTGLSPKEKSYVICSCQTRSTRYAKLKKLAAEAIEHHKIFSVYGSCNAVRKALLERGWVEKVPATRMNLTRIRNGNFANKTEVHSELERLLLSNLVEKYNPNFIWWTKEEFNETFIDMSKESNGTALVNKLKIDAMWTSKQGLCSSMKRNYWFYIEDIAEVNGPRTYNTYDAGEIEGFVKDFKITACTSLLKWILSMVANKRPVFHENGKISINVILFALNRCKEYLFRKQNKDIDHPVSCVSTGQWNGFLKKYYRIIARDDIFQTDKDNKVLLYLGYAKFLLKEIHKYRPQLSCEGCHNIWIIKPAHCSRGRGIRMASKLGVITNLLSKANAKYVIQKYIEEPLLIHETKFDLRQYYLVTSTYPLVIWMYRDCYLKFSSQKYNLKNYHESIHLTNNAVQRKYKNCTERNSELPQNNMWDLDKYKDYLNRIGKDTVWNNVIYPGMKKSIIGIMGACQDSMSTCKNRFELYGCDFILDREYRPWLIEINSCPDLSSTTHVTGKICPAVVSDIIKVVIDYARDSSASTGKFECVYRQPVTTPRYGGAADLSVRGYSLPLDYFYKGNIEIKESYADPHIGKERDIVAVLNRMKEFYDTEIMVEPEDDSDANKKEERETCTHNTDSECELDVAATVITEQLDELLDRITSDLSLSLQNGKHGSNSKSKTEFKRLSVISHTSKKSLTFTQSLTDIKSLLSKTYSCLSDTIEERMNEKQKFSFSKLDDGPVGKASCIEVNQEKSFLSYYVKMKNIPKTITAISHSKILSSSNSVQRGILSKLTTKKSLFEPNLSLAQRRVLEATTNIVSFINRKEKEYMNEIHDRKNSAKIKLFTRYDNITE